ncbi:response regulator [Chitinophaga sp. SYP-B3965]|uniref:LytR/AlgR family response regulator transcription factor n=1 Tax=Chitinophaga sp. SYP-B3965 TaxID=2663120 RepID=UPI001299F49B|nr:LytTR family DNA-binding domain-containing protein [Chitinophaga sp. SYP-B3965]MRG44825.1 response regulator [Chitinophaga sp. SYP-B3965]
MPLQALIIDDEPLAHEVISLYAKDIPFLQITGHCYQATEALEYLSRNNVDLLFLDIQLPRIKGLDLLKILKRKPLVIITSAFGEFALESFELDVCDYLLKPFSFERFLKAVTKAMEQHRLQQPVETPIEKATPDQLFIKTDKRFVQLEMKDIFYLESAGNYVKIWTKDEFLLTPRTLTSFEEQLPAGDFIRIHKSFIVNKQHVDYLEGNMVVLKNGKTLLVGKNYKNAFKLI